MNHDESLQLLTELTTSDVHVYDDKQDVLRCVFCGYQHKHFDAEVRVQQKQHHVECLVVRAKVLLVRVKKEGEKSA